MIINDYRFNEKFMKLYLNTPENKLINKLLKDVLAEILSNYNSLPSTELKWLESYLNCIIEVKKVLDIPKQLNLLIYQDNLPDIKEKFLKLLNTAPAQYRDTLNQFHAVLDQELNFIITMNSMTKVPDQNSTAKEVIKGFHLSKYKK